MPRINIERTAAKLSREIELYLAFFAIAREEVDAVPPPHESGHTSEKPVVRARGA